MPSDTKRCFTCGGRGLDAPGWIECDESGMPSAICFGRPYDCPDCNGTGRVPKAIATPKPVTVPVDDKQEGLWP